MLLNYFLFLGDLNLYVIFFLLVLSSLLISTNSVLHLLLTAELLWITLYIITLFVGFVYDSLNLLSLTFFFLILSAVEFAVGLVIMLLQHTLTRSVSLSDNDMNAVKFSTRLTNNVNINRLNWKF